ncbi:hypothetical protein J1605_009552 [Eschrichtius robustus]|uniref:Uncharacterized protein n=1 Tax=Eschrichtius robustus TaxID=9764 RepID=A0AB34GX16_ESCRO|nr:hypothetical protein J1605_009552 [Eschrichtius robustus]
MSHSCYCPIMTPDFNSLGWFTINVSFRRRSVSSKAIQPTWIPFSSTLSSQQRLKCTMRLMTGGFDKLDSSSLTLLQST